MLNVRDLISDLQALQSCGCTEVEILVDGHRLLPLIAVDRGNKSFDGLVLVAGVVCVPGPNEEEPT